MPRKNFTIQVAERPTSLALEWRGFWKEFHVLENGQQIGTVSGYKELRSGREFSLSDGTPLSVQLKQVGFAQELQLLHSGNPVKGSGADPEVRVRVATIIVFVLAGLNLLAGMAGLFLALPASIGLGPYNLILCPIYVVAAVLMRRLSILGLALAVGVFAGDAVMAFLMQLRLGLNIGPSWIMVRIFLMAPMILAAKPMMELRRARKAMTSDMQH